MKCFLHPEKDAIGVCVTCGRGVCETCSVSIGGKIYCKQCVEKAVVKPSRAASITVASILFYVFGILGIIGSFFILIGWGLVASLTGTSYVGNMFGLTTGVVLILGLISLILSILEIVAGHWLWHSLKKGGILGLILCILGILLSVPFFFVPIYVLANIIGVILDVLLAILIAIGWGTLK